MKRIAAVLVSAVLAGCYLDRLTTNYSDAYDLTNGGDDSAVLDESARNEVEDARIRKRLMELDMEEEPVTEEFS